MRPLAIILATLLLLCSCEAGTRYAKLEGFTQGGTWHAICRIPEGLDAGALQQGADSILRSINLSLSGYNRGSLLSRINSGEDLPMDGHLLRNFNLSKEIWEISGGAFDPSAAPVFDRWGFGFAAEAESAVPSAAELDSLLAFCGMDLFSTEEREDGIHLVRADSRCRLNFNAIAQGYSCDTLGRWLESLGCDDYMVEVGREILCRGRSARGGKWIIGIEYPQYDAPEKSTALIERLSITDCGIVTSGNYRKYYVRDGRRYAHTIDPRSGMSVEHNLLSATVIASDAATADAYATWMMVTGPEAARRIADSLGFTLYLVEDGQPLVRVGSSPSGLQD